MRVAAIYDIHGNLPALEAVLQEVRRTGVDQVVVGGDVVPGPMPAKPSRPCSTSISRSGSSAAMARPQCSRSWRARTWAPCRNRPERPCDGRRSSSILNTNGCWRAGRRRSASRSPALGDVLFCHATPRSDTEIFTRLTPEDRLLPGLRRTRRLRDRLRPYSYAVRSNDREDPRRECRQRRDAVRGTGCLLALARTRRPASAHTVRSRGRPPSGFETRHIRKLEILRHNTSCNPPRRLRCWKFSAASNRGKIDFRALTPRRTQT